MCQAGGGFDFPQESLAPHGGRELGRQDLDGHGTTMFVVVGEVDRRHPTTPELALDRVLARERGPQLGKRVGHQELLPAGSLHFRARRWARPGLPSPDATGLTGGDAPAYGWS